MIFFLKSACSRKNVYLCGMKGLKFIDFCAGIGGGRVALERSGMECVGFSEIDKNAISTYKLFFGEEENFGDLNDIDTSKLPEFDLLIAGFPCQSFSIVGKRKGFDDNRGLVIYGIERILRECSVKYFILENVKGLVNHDKGRTFEKILTLLNDAGYDVYHRVISSTECGIPQIRERIYFVGIKRGLQRRPFKFPRPINPRPLSEFLIDEDAEILDIGNATFQRYLDNKYNAGRIDLNYILSHDYWVVDTRQSDLRVQKHFCPTIRAGRQGLLYVKNGQLRVLSGKESLLLQGFPKELAERAVCSVAESRIKMQAGNAMTVAVVERLAHQIMEAVSDNNDLVELGSQTAKRGFSTERWVVEQFNTWQVSDLARRWLISMEYNLAEIESVRAAVVRNKDCKTDVTVEVRVYFKDVVDVQNIQVKLVSGRGRGFNQVDKRRIATYCEKLWQDMPDDVVKGLEYFCGERRPCRRLVRDSRRMFMDELPTKLRRQILEWFTANKQLIVSDVVKGRGRLAAEWVLVVRRPKGGCCSEWAIANINQLLSFLCEGGVEVTSRGNLQLGRLTVQRKGGDAGRETARSLQFKLHPGDILDRFREE